ncbi:cytochrome P450 6B7 [Plutella xylostella]|uniref:cytochrome P450 6B7 n=1 Tax=Plutella xylostella TaxID=51655 RepID=UPI002032E8A2|nr:cytochrome P450 6B7 [Plutella xylostella]XP_048485388.1 cytochrome P450 6B7 [Plutella xylostella]
MALLTITAFVIFASLLYFWVKHKYAHWEKKGIKSPPVVPFIGHFGRIITFKESIDGFTKRIYEDFPNEPAVGTYRCLTPAVVLRDPELIKQVMIKDFPVFEDRGIRALDDPINDNLFVAEGETWRILRQKLTPIFTSGKLRNMMPLIDKCVGEYLEYVDGLVARGVDHEVRDLSSKYTLEVIGSCAFGVDMDVFNEKENIFRDVGNRIFSPSLLSRFAQFADFLIPGTLNFLHKTKIYDINERTQTFFLNLVNKIVGEREGRPKSRKDFMDLMIELKEQKLIEKREHDKVAKLEMSPELMAAQAVVFYAAGFETSSATMSFLIHELAFHQDIQQRLHDEICAVTEKHGGKLTYDALSEMTYLEMCFDETLRKYPIVGTLIRKALVDYQFPGTKLKIDKGTVVFLPVGGLQSDSQYFENPDEFDPERFSPENKGKIPQCVYMPFGEGPRHCIGIRFAKVQSMIGLAAFLKRFKVTPSDNSKRDLSFDAKSITLTSDRGIWVKITKR